MPGLIGSLGTVAYDIVANDQTGAGITSSRAGLMSVGAAFSAVGFAAVGMTNDIQSSFKSFDEAMTEVRALMGTTDEAIANFNGLRDAALDLSKQYPITATDIANSMYLMVSVGYEYTEMMATIPEAAKLATAGSMEMAEATNSIINVMGVYGKETYTAAEITKVFANAVGVGKYEMGDFMTEIMKNIGVASQLGITFNDLAAYNVALQNSFTSSEEAGTSLNRMLLTMTTTGADTFKELGISLTDSTGKFRDLNDIMIDVKTALDGVSNEQERLNILNDMFGTYGQRAAIALMSQTEEMPELRKNMEEMNLIQDQTNTKLESYGAKLEIANNKMEAAKIALGEGMAPATIIVADAISGLASVLEELPPPLQAVGGTAIYAAQGLSAIGPALMGIAALKMVGAGGILTSITSGLSSLGASAAAAASTVGGTIAIGITGGLVAGLAGVWTLDKLGILKGLSDLGRQIESSPIGSIIMNSMKIVLAPLGSLGAAIIDIVHGDFAKIGPDIVKPFEQAGEAAQRNVDRIKSAFSGIGSSVTTGVNDLGGAVKNMVNSFSGIGSIAGYASSAFSGIGSAFSGMAGQVRGIFSQMVGAIQNVISSTASGFYAAGHNMITWMVNGIMAAADGIIRAIGSVLDKVHSMISFRSPAKEGPLSEEIDWAAYLTSGMEKAAPAVTEAASTNLAAPVAAAIGSAPGPTAAGGGGGGGGTVNIAAGAIVINGAGQNAEEIANQVIAKLSQQMASKRQQKGYRTTT